MINIILFGAPGSGKGTQSDKIAKKFELVKISTGDILRECLNDATNPLYSTIKEKYDKGQLVSDDIINQMIVNYIDSSKNNNGYIFDGFPRNIAQGEFLQDYLQKSHNKVDKAILMDIDAGVLIDRIVNRFTCNNCGAIYNSKTKKPTIDNVCDICVGTNFKRRSDDNEETVKKRLTEYKNLTESLINFYEKQGLLITVDANREVDVVTQDLYDIISHI